MLIGWGLAPTNRLRFALISTPQKHTNNNNQHCRMVGNGRGNPPMRGKELAFMKRYHAKGKLNSLNLIFSSGVCASGLRSCASLPRCKFGTCSTLLSSVGLVINRGNDKIAFGERGLLRFHVAFSTDCTCSDTQYLNSIDLNDRSKLSQSALTASNITNQLAFYYTLPTIANLSHLVSTPASIAIIFVRTRGSRQ